MGAIINFKCESCDFEFQDKDLIFYLDEEDKLIEESLTMISSANMTKSLLEGFLYESYCPNCKKIIKTYVPEMNNITLNEEEITEIILRFNDKIENVKILFFDFKKTNYRSRRDSLKNNSCPNCKKEMSLFISEETPCPKCGNSIIETMNMMVD